MLQKIVEKLSPYIDYETVIDVHISFFSGSLTISNLYSKFYNNKKCKNFDKGERFSLQDISNKYNHKVKEIDIFISNINSFKTPYIIDFFTDTDGWTSFNLDGKRILVLFNNGDIEYHCIDNLPNEQLSKLFPLLNEHLDILKLYKCI